MTEETPASDDRVVSESIRRKASAPDVGSVKMQRARRDLWYRLQDLLVQHYDDADPSSTTKVADAKSAASGIFVALTCMAIRLADDPERLLKIAELGEGAIRKPSPDDQESISAVVADLIQCRTWRDVEAMRQQLDEGDQDNP